VDIDLVLPVSREGPATTSRSCLLVARTALASTNRMPTNSTTTPSTSSFSSTLPALILRRGQGEDERQMITLRAQLQDSRVRCSKGGKCARACTAVTRGSAIWARTAGCAHSPQLRQQATKCVLYEADTGATWSVRAPLGRKFVLDHVSG